MSSSLTPDGVFQVVFRHKGKMAAIFAVTLLAGWGALVVWPRAFESEVKLIVRVGRESVTLDPTATTGQTLMLQKSQEDEINSALDILNSRRLAELVVDRLGPEFVLTGGPAEASSSAHTDEGDLIRETRRQMAAALNWCLNATHVRDPVSDRERAVRTLRRRLTIYAPKQSTVITINCRAKSPEAARQIAAELTEAYLSEHVRVSRTHGSRAFFDEQSALLADRLQEKIEETGEFRRSHAIVSIPANEELVKEQLAGVEQELRLATVGLAKASGEAARLKSQLAGLEPELVGARVGSADLTWSGMRQLIFQLELQEQELAARYTAEHPLLVTVRNQLQSIRKEFDETKADRSDATVTPNPLVQELTQQLLLVEAQAQGLEQSIAALETEREAALARLDGLIQQESQLTRLEREVAVLESNYRNHQEKLEEARIIDALEAERISNVNVVQPATLVERPVSPNKRAIAALALFLGITGALGVAFLAEAVDPTLRTREQAESQLQMPVLSTIPARARRRDLLKSLNRPSTGDILDLHCKSLLQQVLYAQPQADAGSTTLGVLSVSPGNGGSTLAAQLAVVASRDLGLSTLLIDTDNEQKFVSRAFRLNGAPGLRELLANEAAEADCIQQIGKRNLSVISSASQDRPGALKLDPRQVGTRLESLRRRYDLVIVDLPPAASSSDGVLLSGLLDHVLLVVESEKTVGASARRVRAQLLRSNAKLSGAVLTKTRDYLPRWLHASV